MSGSNSPKSPSFLRTLPESCLHTPMGARGNQAAHTVVEQDGAGHEAQAGDDGAVRLPEEVVRQHVHRPPDGRVAGLRNVLRLRGAPTRRHPTAALRAMANIRPMQSNKRCGLSPCLLDTGGGTGPKVPKAGCLVRAHSRCLDKEQHPKLICLSEIVRLWCGMSIFLLFLSSIPPPLI